MLMKKQNQNCKFPPKRNSDALLLDYESPTESDAETEKDKRNFELQSTSILKNQTKDIKGDFQFSRSKMTRYEFKKGL